MSVYHQYIGKQYYDFSINNIPLNLMDKIDDMDLPDFDRNMSEIEYSLNKKSGYIYIANNIHSGYFKVGMTRKNPYIRVKELNSAGVLHELDIVRFFQVKDISLERIIHHKLTTVYPASKFKEFFRLPLNLIEQIIEEEIRQFDLFLKTILPYYHK